MDRRIPVSLAAVAAAALLGAHALADARPVTSTGTATKAVTLAGQVVVPSTSTSATVAMAPPQCDTGQSFLATALSGSPDPTAAYSNGVSQAEFTPSWGASVPLAQPLTDGTVRQSLLTFAIIGAADGTRQGPLYGDAHLPSGVPVVLQGDEVPVTVTIFAGAGHTDITYDVALTGRCATPADLPPTG